MCRRFDIKTAFTSKPTLKNLLVQVKGKPLNSDGLGIVYCIPCSCGSCYIGEIGRNLSTRMSEHKRAVQYLDMKTAHIAENFDHKILWEETTIKEFEMNWYKRRVKEAIWIRVTERTDPGISINKTWVTMLPSGGINLERKRQESHPASNIPSSQSTTVHLVTVSALVMSLVS